MAERECIRCGGVMVQEHIDGDTGGFLLIWTCLNCGLEIQK